MTTAFLFQGTVAIAAEEQQETVTVETQAQAAPPETEAPQTEAPATEAPATEAPVTEAPATEAPVTEAPATEAPATEAPATEAPTTEAPATEAPATEAPATEAPATEASVTEAPATEAPATEAPVTEAPATEAPATEVPDTEVPEETLPAETEIEASSEETETEKETYKTNFRFENAEVLVTANASEAAKLPGNTEMRVEKLQPGTQEYESAKAAVEAQTGVKEGAEYLFYDVNFFADGQKMNYPDGTVTIQIQFKTEQKDSSMESQTVMHIDENSQVKDVTAPAAEGSSLSSVNFAL